ncbi:endonuclease/exonuclease/phosphatase family protein [Microvirga sp. Mcv34]|uniref:endonuclease/exonuclease/phosphatase family protein n=1 Tax=Microvirga sp. Mcv34 TaxID=2926016 RepID=UPI0021C81EDC|nr:endonuclease/exonuclease/phosphatase family protein [Microvirga sp. Mcv34]
MKLVTWNIQWGLGCDGRVDLARIVDDARSFCDADVFCFQEISHGFAPHDGHDDQPARLASLLPGYAAIFRPAVEMRDGDGSPQVFGNMILSRLPVLQVTSHMLPWPATEVRSMQRQALEAIVATDAGPIRITTCHLEYHSHEHRQAQVGRLRELHEDAVKRARLTFRDATDGPYRTLPAPIGSIVCGDFNIEPHDPVYMDMRRPFTSNVPAFVDAWTARHDTIPHPPTTGVADHVQWPQGPHSRDYIFVSEDLADRIVDVSVDVETTSSDHQPVAMTLGG